MPGKWKAACTLTYRKTEHDGYDRNEVRCICTQEIVMVFDTQAAVADFVKNNPRMVSTSPGITGLPRPDVWYEPGETKYKEILRKGNGTGKDEVFTVAQTDE